MMRRGGQQQQQQQQQSKALNELCSLILTIIGSPPHSFLPIPYNNNDDDDDDDLCSSRTATATSLLSSKQFSAGGFACLLLGVSLTLMLCGSVTFVIGFILMPWVIGFLLLFYFLGVVSTLSGLGRAILYPPSPKEISAWNYS